MCRGLSACAVSHGLHCPWSVGARVYTGTTRSVEDGAPHVRPQWYRRYRGLSGEVAAVPAAA